MGLPLDKQGISLLNTAKEFFRRFDVLQGDSTKQKRILSM